jgi:hypothetical protein
MPSESLRMRAAAGEIRMLAEMAGGPGEAPAAARTQADVYFLERAVEAGEGLFQVSGTPPGQTKIFRPELIPA